MNITTTVNAKKSRRHRRVTRKLPYQLIPNGTMVLIDTSNLISALGTAHAARRLSIAADALADWGYRPWFVWDLSSYQRALRRQDNSFETNALNDFANRRNVVLVDRIEADLVLIQMAQEISESVIVSLDQFRDYESSYPDIVTTRRRPFAAFSVDGRTFLTILGMRKALAVDEAPKANPVADVHECPTVLAGDDKWALEIDEDARMRRSTPPAVVSSRRGLLGAADDCILRGNICGGYKLFSREAEKSPVAYRDIADFVDDADGDGIVHSAAHFDCLAERGVTKLRERSRRASRQRAERRRLAYNNVA